MSTSLISVFGGAWRLTYRRLCSLKHWLIILGCSALLGVLCHATIRNGNAHGFYQWVADTYLSLLLPIFAFILGAGAIRDDLGPGMADYVFTRPVGRPAYLVAKYLSHLLCALLDFVPPFAALLIAGATRHIPALGAAAPLLLFGQALTIAAFGAFGLLCGVLTARYVVIGLIYGVAVEVGLGNIPTQLDRISLTHHVRAMLSPLAGRADAVAESPVATFLQLLLWSTAMLVVAALVFSRRELAAPPRDA